MGHSAIMSVRITGNSNDAVKAFEKATRKAAAFGSFMGNVAAKGVEKLWDKLSSFTGDVVEMSDSVDKFKNTMKFAGLDTSAVDKAAKAARKYADETVYGLDDIQNTMAQLAANGIGNYTDLAQAAGNLNAVAGGNADTFKSVAMMLTQTAGAGKLTTENWNQLADAIPGASGKLQEAMKKNGAYTGNFRDAMAKGEITADEFNKALLDLGMTDIAKEAATSTKTIEGALGNLEAAVTGGLTDAFDLIKPAVTGAMSAAATAIEDFSKKATEHLKAFADAFLASGALDAGKRMLDDVAGAGRTVADAFKSLVDAMNPFPGQIRDASDAGTIAGDAFGALSDIVGKASDAVKQAAAWLKDLAKGLKDTGAAKVVGDMFDRLQTAASGVVDMLKAIIGEFPSLGSGADVGKRLGDAFKTVGDIVGKALDTLKGVADWASQHSGEIISAASGIAAGFAAFEAAQGIKKTIDLIKGAQAALVAFKAAQEASTAAQAAMNAVMNANPIGLIVTAIGAAVAALTWFFTQTEVGRQAWGAFMDWLAQAWQSLVEALTPILDAISQAWQALCDLVGALWDAVQSKLTELWNGLQPILQPILDWMAVGWQNLGDAVKLIWQTVCDAIKTFIDIIKNAFKLATSLIKGDWQGAGDAVKNIWNAVGGFLSGLANRIAGFFSSVGGRIKGYFDNAANGVKNAWNNVCNWFSGLPGRIAGFFANAGSLLWNAGSNIINGLWNGLKSAWGNVTSWVSGLGDWIAAHKGPPAYDKVLLTENGRLIMQGFAKGLRQGFERDVTSTIRGVNTKLSSMSFTDMLVGASAVVYQDNRSTNVTVSMDGVITDPDATARQIRVLLDNYAGRRA